MESCPKLKYDWASEEPLAYDWNAHACTWPSGAIWDRPALRPLDSRLHKHTKLCKHLPVLIYRESAEVFTATVVSDLISINVMETIIFSYYTPLFSMLTMARLQCRAPSALNIHVHSTKLSKLCFSPRRKNCRHKKVLPIMHLSCREVFKSFLSVLDRQCHNSTNERRGLSLFSFMALFFSFILFALSGNQSR